MSGDWTAEELDTVAAADELQIAALRPDGSLHPYTTIWVVRVGDDLYVQSCRGRAGAWFRSAQRCRAGRIRAGGVERDVTFDAPRDADHDAIDRAYRTKYARYASSDVDPMLNLGARAATLRLTPRIEHNRWETTWQRTRNRPARRRRSATSPPRSWA
jgi:hypothetical protein